MKKFLTPLILLFLLSLPASAASVNRSCEYVAGDTPLVTAFTQCDAEIAKVFARAPIETTATNSGNDITATSSPAVTTLTDGLSIYLDSPVTITGAAQLNLDSTGLKAIVSNSGAALGSGDLVSGTRYHLVYKLSTTSWVSVTPLGSGSASASNAYITTANTASLSAERAAAEGAGIDLTDGGANSTLTITLDLTELNTAVFGSGTFTTLRFDAGATDPILTFGSATLDISATTTVTLDDELELRFLEEDAGGSNYKGFKSPAAITANTTCTFEDDANFIPDSCVGDGSDANTLGSDGDKGDITVGGTGTTLTIDAGAVNDTALAAGAVDGGTGGEIADGSVTADDLGTDSVSADELNATGVEAELEAVVDLADLQGDLALGTKTSGNYVLDVADGTGIDGTAAAEGATYTPTLDLTEVNSTTWGSGTFTTMTFNAGAVDPVLTFGSGTLDISAVTTLTLDDELELRFFEEDAGGTNYIGFKAPAAITANVTCTFENDANPIPDSCVGDGSDAGAAGGDNVTVNTVAVTDPDLDDATPAAAAGGKNVTWQLSGSDVSAYVAAASQTAPGVVEEATDAEVIAATDADRYVTPAGLKRKTESFCVAASDETTAITTGNKKVVWNLPYAFTLSNVYAYLNTVSSSGTPTIDLNEDPDAEGATADAAILSTKITIDANERRSSTAATPPVISDTAIGAHAEMSADIDVAGTGAKGLKICLVGYQT